MTTKFVSGIRAVVVFIFALFSVIACENDFEDIGVDIVDNNLFNTKDAVFEVIAYNGNVERSRVDNLPVYNIGILNDVNFGYLNASFVSQLSLFSAPDFGLNPIIDIAVLDIPYFAARDTVNYSDGKPKFVLDSIIGDLDEEYTIKVHRLATFLNELDPLNPTLIKNYYSDEVYSSAYELYSDSFKPDENDTVLYVERKFLDDDINTVDAIDTIKKDDVNPSIKFVLDKAEIENIFINNASTSDLSSPQNFNNYFRGLWIEPQGSNGSLMTLLMSDAVFSIYYTNEVLTDEDGVIDLNGDGDMDDVDVPVRTAQNIDLALSGIRAGTYNRSYTGSTVDDYLINPDMINGDDKLFIQGSAGSMSEIELFKDVDSDSLTAIRNENWLINGAILDLYVDEISNDNIPNQLYLYNADENSIIIDAISEARVNGIAGFLEYNDDGTPLKYQFRITDYISEVLRPNNPRKLAEKFAIRTYHSTDAIVSFNDTIVRDFSWRSKGVVLKGNNLTDKTDETRFKLKIYYTVDNN
jgi:hypothetical protein